MILKRITIYLFIASLLSSNAVWAGEGLFGQMTGDDEHMAMDVDSDVMHHLVDEHHDGHGCHMAAHLVALTSNAFSLTYFGNTQILPLFEFRFSSYQLPPPNKPPRA